MPSRWSMLIGVGLVALCCWGASSAFSGPTAAQAQPTPTRTDAVAPANQGPAASAQEPAATILTGTSRGILQLDNTKPVVDPMIAAAGAPFFPSRASTHGQVVTPDMFTKPESCKEC